MQQVTDFDRRVRNMYDLAVKVTTPLAQGWFALGKWGVESRGDKMELLKDFGPLYLYLGMLEWKAWEQNTFFPQFDDEGCQIFDYPSTIADAELIDCIIKYFGCQCVGFKGILRKFGVLPIGQAPDGISYMRIQSGFTPCDNNLFQINKPRGEDFV
jgi:hypothetical protein